MWSLRQPEFEGSVVGAGGDQLSIWGHVHAHHLALVSCQCLQRRPARVTPNLGRVVVRSSQEELSVCGCTQIKTTLESRFLTPTSKFLFSNLKIKAFPPLI